MKRSLSILSLVAFVATGSQLDARSGDRKEPADCIMKTCVSKFANIVPAHVGQSWPEGNKICYCIHKGFGGQGGVVRPSGSRSARPTLPMEPGPVVLPRSKFPMGPGPVVISPSKKLIDAAKKAAAGVNVILPRDFGRKYYRLNQKKYNSCYFFPTSANRGFAACGNSAFFSWDATAQCKAVTPLSLKKHTHGPYKGKKVYMALGSYSNPDYMPGVRRAAGGQSSTCTLYGRIDYHPLSGFRK